MQHSPSSQAGSAAQYASRGRTPVQWTAANAHGRRGIFVEQDRFTIWRLWGLFTCCYTESCHGLLVVRTFWLRVCMHALSCETARLSFIKIRGKTIIWKI